MGNPLAQNKTSTIIVLWIQTIKKFNFQCVRFKNRNKNAVEIANNAIKHAKSTGKKIVIVDTAGRLAVDEQMMQLVKSLLKVVLEGIFCLELQLTTFS